MSENQPTDPLAAVDKATDMPGGKSLRELAEERKDAVPPEPASPKDRATRREKRAADNRSLNAIIVRFHKLDPWAKQQCFDELKEMIEEG